YKGLDVHKCPAWTQGPTFLQHLALLEGFNVPRLKHNSPDYLHVWIESAKLAFADREAYYGDPVFDQVPLDVLLSSAYAAARRHSKRWLDWHLTGHHRPGVCPGDAGPDVLPESRAPQCPGAP